MPFVCVCARYCCSTLLSKSSALHFPFQIPFDNIDGGPDGLFSSFIVLIIAEITGDVVIYYCVH